MNTAERGPAQAGPAQVRPHDPADLGRRVTHRREQLGLSRGRLAAEAGITTFRLDHLESAPDLVELKALSSLAHALGTTIWYLLGASTDLQPGHSRGA